MKDFNTKIALVTSYLLHPLFMPTNGLVVAYFIGRIQGFNIYASDRDTYTAYIVIFGVFIATAIVPIIITLILKSLNLISSLHMPKREERMIPFLVTGVAYVSIIFIYTKVLDLHLPPEILSFMMGAALAIIIGFLITSSYKISIHMIGIGGVVGVVVLLSKLGEEVLIYPLIATIIASGFIAFSRIQLKAHTYQQVISGFILGFTCEIIPLFFIN